MKNQQFKPNKQITDRYHNNIENVIKSEKASKQKVKKSDETNQEDTVSKQLSSNYNQLSQILNKSINKEMATTNITLQLTSKEWENNPLGENLSKWKDQVDQMMKKYEGKLEEQLKYNTIIQKQIQALKSIIQINKTQLGQKQTKIKQLKDTLDKFINGNMSKIKNISDQFRKIQNYFQQSYQYAIKRIEDVQLKVHHMNLLINQSSANQINQVIQEIKTSSLFLVKNIVINNNSFIDRFNQQLKQHIDNSIKLESQLRENLLQQVNLKDYKIKKQVISQQIQYFNNLLKSWQDQFSPNQTSIVVNKDQQSILRQKTHYSQPIITDKLTKEKNKKITYLNQVVKRIESKVNGKMIEMECQLQEKYNQNQQKNRTIVQLQNQIQIIKKREIEIQKRSTKSTKSTSSLIKQEDNEKKIEQFKNLVSSLRQQNLQLKQRLNEQSEQISRRQEESQNKVQEVEMLLKNIENDIFGKDKYQIKQLKKQSSILSFGTEENSYNNLNSNRPYPQNLLQNCKYPSCNSQVDVQELIMSFNSQISQLYQQNQLLIQKQNILKMDYENIVDKFQKQSLSFQNMIKVLKRQNAQLNEQKIKLIQMLDIRTRNNTNTYSPSNKKKIFNDEDNGSNHLNNSFFSTKNTTNQCQNYQMLSNQVSQIRGRKDSHKLRQKSIVKSGLIPITSKSQFSPLTTLLDAIKLCQFEIPVPCQIDQTGYLKHAYFGTYIIDKDGNMYRLTPQQIKIAKRNNLITIV